MQMTGKQVVFTAGSGRSGTTSLANFIQNNISDCTSLHEPSFISHGIWKIFKKFQLPKGISEMDVRGFENAIIWCDTNDPRYEELIRFRAEKIRGCKGQLYFEANHAFLKSLWKGMISEFPDLQVIHLTRHPFEVASSFCNRAQHINLSKNDALKVFNSWNVRPGLNKNVLPDPDFSELSRFQMYLWAWVELELRYVRLKRECPDILTFDMKVEELNDTRVLTNLLFFLGVERNSEDLVLPGVKNANSKKTVVLPGYQEEAATLLEKIPYESLTLLPEPYDLFDYL